MDWPEAFVRIPVADATLNEARQVVDDVSLFEKTRLPILHAFPQLSFDDYWELTVREHAELMVFLQKRGLLDG
jgi:hypothetical protein